MHVVPLGLARAHQRHKAVQQGELDEVVHLDGARVDGAAAGPKDGGWADDGGADSGGGGGGLRGEDDFVDGAVDGCVGEGMDAREIVNVVVAFVGEGWLAKAGFGLVALWGRKTRVVNQKQRQEFYKY